mmetsp:Transcript_44172/g.127560  ORF Transcript_44172/g.127560 Transcript_44172/m.127560 type:complete len:310 (-) Transcript_44172:140-1069(-)
MGSVECHAIDLLWSPARQADTLVYVDVDGVLNVGIRDLDAASLALNERNCRTALRLAGSGANAEVQDSVRRLMSVMRHGLESANNGSYEDLLPTGQHHCPQLLLVRFARILRLVGHPRCVVLSSNWRHPTHASKVAALENDISAVLGEPFAFDTSTALGQESSADQRLACIAEHLAGECERRGRGGSLKVIVLDDFGMTPFDGWTCHGVPMHSPSDMEVYLRSRAWMAAPNLNVSVRLVHCFVEWHEQNDLLVQVGCGLTEADVLLVKDFVVQMGAAVPDASKNAGSELTGDWSSGTPWHDGVDLIAAL